jgi:hypothetical protein
MESGAPRRLMSRGHSRGLAELAPPFLGEATPSSNPPLVFTEGNEDNKESN